MGSNAFYVNRDNMYAEVFAGIENIFKVFRVDVITAFENGKKPYTGIRIGGGGLIGSGLLGATSQRKRASSLSIGL